VNYGKNFIMGAICGSLVSLGGSVRAANADTLSSGQAADAGQMMTVRTFLAPENFFSGTETEANASGTGAATNRNARLELESRGIQFPTGATAKFLPDSDKLVVRDTPEQLDRIAGIIENLSAESSDFQAESDPVPGTGAAHFPTAQDQSTDPADQKVTQDIRLALVTAKDLSVGAQNIIVVTTASHTAYLTGSVVSPSERRHVLALAKAAAGSYKVRMHLTISGG
jgi:osmotically-inducible protein OsmY